MMRVNELFYDQESPQFMSQTSAQQMIRDPKLYTTNLLVETKKPDPRAQDKSKPLVMRVSICCSSCVDMIDYDITKVKGVKTVDYDIYRKKVTVTGTAFSVADVLSAARRHFKDAELWD